MLKKVALVAYESLSALEFYMHYVNTDTCLHIDKTKQSSKCLPSTCLRAVQSHDANLLCAFNKRRDAAAKPGSYAYERRSCRK